MPNEISTIAMTEKNKLNSESVFFCAFEIDIPSLEEPARINNNNADITWRGHTWVAFPMEADELTENIGEAPKFNINVSNVNRVFGKYLNDYDQWCKTNGFSPITVKIYVLNSLALHLDTSENEIELVLDQPKVNDLMASFQLGARLLWTMRYPLRRILRMCQWKFKGEECQYAGTELSCNKTLTRCIALNNVPQYGGFMGAGMRGQKLS